MSPANADCTLTTAPNIYTCSGSTTTGQNILNVDNITVSTTPGFELDATTVNFGSAGLHLWGDGIITYTDVNGSTIDTTGALPNDDAIALRIVIGEDAGANLGSAIIRSNGDFIANGDAVYIGGLGGLPENGVIDAVFTGDITSLGAFNSGLTFFTPGQGATVSVNNVTGANGISATIGGGSGNNEALVQKDLTINVNGTVTGNGTSPGVFFSGIRVGVTDDNIAADVKTNINVAEDGIVQGTYAAINASNFAIALPAPVDNPVVVNNDGIIRNLAATSDSLAIAAGSPTFANSDRVRFIVNNNNLVLGTVNFGQLDDSFNNDGVWNTAAGTNQFGAGIDDLDNGPDGAILAARATGGPVTTTFNGLELAYNQGSIVLQNGLVGGSAVTGDVVRFTNGGNGNFVSAGGRLYLDTWLGNDASPTDILVVDNSELGTAATYVAIANAGGPGAKTTGDGIKVVDVTDEVSDAGAFVSPALFAGAYEYNLFQGGVAATGGDPEDGDWYLRSQLSTGAQTANPYADALVKFGQLSIGTLQQRTGNRLWPNEAPAQPLITKAPVKAPAYSAGADVVGGGMWGRLVGQHGSYDPSSGTAYDADTYLGQVGAEGVIHETSDGALVVGLMATYGSQDVDVGVSRDPVTGARRHGSIDTDAYGAGFNVTWLGTDGLYVDGVGQYTWYDSDLSSSDFGKLVEGNHGDGYALSVEVGKRLALSGGWAWVPQAQLIYSSVDFDDFAMVNPDDTLTRVSAGDGDSLLGRIGVRLETLGTNGTQRFQGYGIVNLTYEFLDGTSVKVGAAELDQQGQDFWGEIGLGGTYAFNDKVSLYGEARYASSLEDAGDSYTYGGNIGLRVNW